MTTRNLTPFGRSGALRAASFDEADNTIEVIWTTGAAVRRYSIDEQRFYEEILEVTPKAVRLDRLNAGAPFLNSHRDGNLKNVIGSVVPGSATIRNGLGLARIKLSRAEPDKPIVDKIRDGIIRNISVGYAIHKVIRSFSSETQEDIWRVVDWEPLEISAVPVPADAGSQIRHFPCVVVEKDHRTVDQIRDDMMRRHSQAINTPSVPWVRGLF